MPRFPYRKHASWEHATARRKPRHPGWAAPGLVWLAVWLAALGAPTARAGEVEFRMVPYDRPDVTVETLERSKPVTRAVTGPQGTEFRPIGLEVVCWARNVLLDGQPLFERYHERRYIDRLPKAKRDLKPGRHVLWPGNHAFTVAADGGIASDDPDLIVAKGLVRIKSYPVTVRAFRVDPAARGAAAAGTGETAPLPDMTIRDANESQRQVAAEPSKPFKPHDLLPVYDRFAPLTVWLPASGMGKDAGEGYVLHPMGLTFRLGDKGIVPVGETAAIGGVKVSNWTIEVPLLPLLVTGEAGCSVVVQGVDKLSWPKREAGETKRVNWYPRRQPYELRISATGPAILVDGDVLALPVKAAAVDVSDRAKGIHRAVLVELATSHYRPGDKARARVRGLDPSAAVAAEKDAKARGDGKAGKNGRGPADGPNLLADAPVFGQVQALGGGPWTDLAVAPAGTGGEVTFVVPAVPADVYRLRLGVRPADENAPPIAAETFITVAPDRPAAIGLFTQRGRTAFYRGESFWVGLGVIARGPELPAGAAVEVDLVDTAGRRLAVLRDELAQPIASRQTLLMRFSDGVTLALAAGEYRLEAKLADLRARPRRITLVEPEPRTHFTNLLSGKYNTLGEEYSRAIQSSQGADDLARTIAGMGYNAFMGMSYNLNRVAHRGVGIERLIRQRPELGPWEAYLQPSGRDRFLDAAVRNNLRFWENMLTYNDTSLPRAEGILAACERFTSLEVGSMRHSPAFQGVCLYDEIYARSLNDGVPIVAAFERAHEMSYRQLHPGMTSAKAMKALERFVGRPAGQRVYDDLEAFRTWPAHEDRAWRVLAERMAAAAKAAMPEAFNFVLNRYWGDNGGNLGQHGREEDVYGPLEAASCVMYKDGGTGDRPVFAPMQADVMRVREGPPVWTQLHNFSGEGIYGAHLLRQAFFALSQKVDGFSYFTIQHNPASPGYVDNRETIRAIAGVLCTRYGDFFLSLNKGYKKVAIYYSRQAGYLASKKANNLRCQCEGLWVACVRAGFPADFLRDDDIRAGRGMDYDVIFAPGFAFEEECPPETLRALRRLVNAGKTLAVERSSKLPVEGAVRLDSELDEYDGKFGGAFPKFIDFESEIVWDQSEQTTKLVGEFLARRIAPAAKHDLLVGPDWLARGAGQYMVVPNFAMTGFTGLYRTLYQAPAVATLTFPKRPPVCYDVLEMRPVPIKTDGDWMTLQADMRHCPGKVFAFLPAAVGSVGLKASPAVRAPGTLRYEVSVLDGAGKVIDASFPLEIRLTDPAGTVTLEVYRAAAPSFAGAWVVPVNAPAGNWTLRVRELVSGAVAEARIAAEAVDGAAAAAVAATLDTRKVLAYDAGRIRAALAPKGPAVAIPLSKAQAWARPAAQRLCDELARRGREAKIVPLDDVLRLPGPWDGAKPAIDGTRLWRGEVVAPGIFAEGPLVLLGRRGENTFLDALIARDELAAPVSDAFPGPARAVLACTVRAFSNRHNTVSVLATDPQGLAAGVDELLALLDAGADGKPHASAEPAHPGVRHAEPGAPGAAGLAAGKPASRERSSFADAIFGEDMVRCMDVDDATGRTLVGTFGYGHNLFCLAADGKELWKVFLPEHNVYFARWYDAGRRVVAATGRGWLVFLLDGATGKVLRKFASTEWPRTHWNEGAVDTPVHIEVNAARRQILVGGLTGLLAVDFDGKRQWFHDRAEAIAAIPKEADPGSAAAAFGNTLAVGNFALSGNGSKIVCGEYEICGSTLVMRIITNVWAFRPKILDAADGKVLAGWQGDPGNQAAPRGWSVGWPAGSDVPYVYTGGLAAPLGLDGTLGPYAVLPGQKLADGSVLVSSPTSVERRAPGGTKVLWRIEGLGVCIPALDRLDAPAGRLYRCDENGGVHCIDLAGGKTLWAAKLPFSAVLAPRRDGLTTGGLDGTVVAFAPDGTRRWSLRLRDLHEMPGRDYPVYVAAGRGRDSDSTGEMFAPGEDRAGEYDGILRMGLEQIDDGTFEAGAKAWRAHAGAVQLAEIAHAGGKSLHLAAGQLVTQAVTRRVVPSGTYLLEFFYRPAGPEAKLIAGAQLAGDSGDGGVDNPATLTASTFRGRPGEWTFGRLAVKSMAATRQMEIGFEAAGGEVLVDDVSLRPVRFPSANRLACEELHAVEPTFARDLRVRYRRIPAALDTKLLSRNRVAAFKQGGTDAATIYTDEQAFLHNGRLDDVGRVWTYVPEAMGFSVVLTHPAWVSHLVLYLNNTTPGSVYRTISIVANDLDAKMPRFAAMVRNNRRRFIVVHFEKPLYTDSLKILPGHQARAHRDCLTEVEVYGPLGGPDQGTAGRSFPDDPNGWPMFMACPSHVPAGRPADLTGTYRELGRLRLDGPAFFVSATAAGGLLTFGDASGSIRSMTIPATGEAKARAKWGPNWVLGTLAPISTPARYAGRLLAGCADQKLHAVADNGVHLWAFQTEGRVYSAPVPDGDDVYFGSDDGKLYKVDADSGILLWEFATAGRIRGAPAMADGRLFVPSWDGFLYAVDAEKGRGVWKAPIAKYTRSSPAVAGGRVYLGDEDGQMRCFEAASGKELWAKPLGGRIVACPVVTEAGAVFANEQGQVALVGKGRVVQWSRKLDSPIRGQPVATRTQLLVPTDGGLEVLRLADGKRDDRIKLPEQPEGVTSVLPYGGRICVLTATARSHEASGRPYTRLEGTARLWVPETKASPSGGKK